MTLDLRKKFDTVLFDLDGTVSNTYEGITRAVKYSLESFGITDDRRALSVFIGPPLFESFEKYYGFDKDGAVAAVEKYREYYAEKGVYQNELYDGVKDVIEKLYSKGVRVVLATSKPEKFALKILEQFDILKYFTFVACATLDKSRVEKSAVISYALENIGPCSAVMVGDRKHDIEGGKANGLFTVGVTYGFGSRDELEKAGADIIIDKPCELLSIVS